MNNKVRNLWLFSLGICLAMPGLEGRKVLAEEKDWGEYEITNDGYGYLSANFPDEYPKESIVVESDSIIEQKSNALLLTLTLEEKIEMLCGNGGMTGGGGPFSGAEEYTDKSYGTGYWKGCARVGIPVVRMYDGPMGVRANSGIDTTRPASELSVASSFSTDTAYEYGKIYAADGQATSGNMQLGIQTDLIRTLSTGRAKDMFGEDWYLEGTIASAMARGLEENGVIACLKHIGGWSNMDEQTMHENYLSVYEMVLKEEDTAHAVMTNYEATNGVMASEDRYLLKEVLREMWGWNGIVLTDWGANYSFTVDDGVTMETPCDVYNTKEAIENALKDGTLTEEDIDEAVYNNLYALGKAGYLSMVQISRDGKTAVDEDPPAAIELSYTYGEMREQILEQNNEAAIQTAQEGSVLLKNEGEVLPLTQESGTVALIGLGSTYLTAGYHGECAFGWLPALAVSPYDALSESYDEVSAYVAQDIVGDAVPEEYLYVDAEAAQHGAWRTGTDGDGKTVETVDRQVNFVTNSDDYHNAEDGTAFPYGEQGAAFTWTTYLKAPESGEYTLKIEGIAASSISGTIEADGKEIALGAAGGAIGSGFVATTSEVTTDTGLDIPKTTVCCDTDTAEEGTAYTRFRLEEGKTYKITIHADGSLDDAYAYQRGTKDMQVRLAWITPSKEKENYEKAVRAAAESETVVLFAHETDALSLDEEQAKLLTECIAAAKEAGNKVVLVLSTGLPVDLTDWVDACDAVLQTWMPGQGGGTVIANILSGKYNPSAKLCVTWPSDFSDDNGILTTEGRGGSKDGVNETSGVSEIKEGIYNGYKWYDATEKEDSVLWDFGYGLSYTQFDYELISAQAASEDEEYGADVTVKVTNTGTLAGSEVVQLYLEAPEEGMVEKAVYHPQDVADSFAYTEGENGETAYFPEIEGVQFAKIQLAGFARTEILQPGESQEVTMHVSQRSLSYWDTSLGEEEQYEREDGTKDKWTVVEGNRTLYVAKSSDQLIAAADVEIHSVKAGASVNAEVQESAKAGEVFRVIIETPADVIGLELKDQNGSAFQVSDVLKENLGESIRFTYYIQADEKGTAQIQIYTKTTEGTGTEPDAVLEIVIE